MNNLIVIKWVQNTDVPIAKIANKTGISRKTLHNIKAGKTARTSTLKKLYLVYQDQINLSNTTLELKGTNMNVDDLFEKIKTDNSIDAQYVIDLQKDKIKSQNYKIKLLKKKIGKLNKLAKVSKKNNWLDIDFDVITRQTYDKSFRKYATYEIIRYQDFFAKLGYDDSEIKFVYDKHKKQMLNCDYASLERDLFCLVKTDPWVMNYRKRDLSMFEYLDVRMRLGKPSATYDCPIQYYAKDRSIVNAYMYCSWDLQRLTGETKIKFLNE